MDCYMSILVKIRTTEVLQVLASLVLFASLTRFGTCQEHTTETIIFVPTVQQLTNSPKVTNNISYTTPKDHRETTIPRPPYSAFCGRHCCTSRKKKRHQRLCRFYCRMYCQKRCEYFEKYYKVTCWSRCCCCPDVKRTQTVTVSKGRKNNPGLHIHSSVISLTITMCLIFVSIFL